MGWGVSYTYEGYLSRLTKSELEDKLQELEEENAVMWREILAYMSATPLATYTNPEGDSFPYPEYLANKIEQYMTALRDNEQLITHISDCLETLKEHPETVKEE